MIWLALAACAVSFGAGRAWEKQYRRLEVERACSEGYKQAEEKYR